MANYTTTVQEDVSQNNVTIKEIAKSCLRNWYWFVISVLVALAIGWFYIHTTPPQYSRHAELLIKVDSKGKSTTNDVSALGDFDMFKSWSNVSNELTTILSPDIMEEVVERLGLQTSITTRKGLTKELLYGDNLPVEAQILGLQPEETASFDMEVLSNGKVKLSNFVKNREDLDASPMTVPMGKIVKTPVGQVMLSEGKAFASMPRNTTMHLSRGSMERTVRACSDRFTTKLTDDKSSVLSMDYTDYSPQRAEDILNMIINIYNEKWVDDRNQVALSTSKFIDERLAVIEKELGSVDNDISSYKSANLVPDINQASSIHFDQARLAGEKIVDLSTQIQMGKYLKSYIQNPANNQRTLPVNSGFESPVLSNQISAYNDEMITRNNYAANSSSQNPIVRDHDAALADLRASIVASIDNQLVNLNSQLRSQERVENEAIGNLSSNPGQAKYLLSVERQQKVKESLYLYLLQKREENELSQAFVAYNTRVITKPRGSSLPSYPVRRNIYLIALLIGMLIPVAVIYLRENFNTKVRGRVDMEGMKIPIIGEIPEYMGAKSHLISSKIIPSKLLPAKFNANKTFDPLVVSKGNRNMINEAFRVLRTNLSFITGDMDDGRVISFTSFNPGSGKSFISINLAVAYAIRGRKVLVIDCDLRRGSATKYLKVKGHGIADYLAGKEDDYHNLIQTLPDYPGLSVLPVGTIPPNPTELLEDRKFGDMIKAIKGDYDYVFLDCPPIDILADTHIIDKFVDRTIFVVRIGLLSRTMLVKLDQIYEEKRLKNVTAVLNATQASGTYGSYSYYGHSSHYYAQ